MQNTFPADHELLEFFGVEPRVLDPGVPWFYNNLEFELEREGIEIRCRLAPSCGDINVRLRSGGVELMRFDLPACKSIRLVTKTEVEVLVATLERELRDETFHLVLKPRLWIGFGAFQTIPPRPDEQ